MFPSPYLPRNQLLTSPTPNKELVCYHGAVTATISSPGTTTCLLLFGYGISAALSLLQCLCRKTQSVQPLGTLRAHASFCARRALTCTWTPSGACCVNVPMQNFRIVDLKWNSDGSCLLLKDREFFCCAAIVSALPEEGPDQSDESSEDDE